MEQSETETHSASALLKVESQVKKNVQGGLGSLDYKDKVENSTVLMKNHLKFYKTDRLLIAIRLVMNSHLFTGCILTLIFKC